MKQTMKQAVLRAMHDARKKIRQIEDGSKVVKQGGAFGDLHNDTEIKADKVLGDLFARRFLKLNPHRLAVEGGIDKELRQHGSHSIFVDPLDGSLNYKTKGASLGLPYSAVVTVLNEYDNSRFHEHKSLFHSLEAGAIMDLRNGDLWQHFKSIKAVDGTGLLTWGETLFNGKTCRPILERTLDLGSQIVIGEFYYTENRERLVKAFTGRKGWLRNPGSAAYEMALVSSGQAAAYICDRQKQHELGAAYLLVKGAGGVAVDFDGKDLGERVYDFKTQTPVVLAANQSIADQILELLNK